MITSDSAKCELKFDREQLFCQNNGKSRPYTSGAEIGCLIYFEIAVSVLKPFRTNLKI